MPPTYVSPVVPLQWGTNTTYRAEGPKAATNRLGTWALRHQTSYSTGSPWSTLYTLARRMGATCRKQPSKHRLLPP